jgi:hypothetical protein
MRVSGRVIISMDKANKSGRMEHSMMESGGRIRPVEKAHLSIIMEMCFREIGHITKLMDMVCSSMPIVRQCIGGTGLMMCRMGKVRKFMRMGIVMLVSSRTEEGTD